ncbi:MAG: efflux RND transporter periplasmic adaptor subunit [Deltaproteobacteria bacterium]|nr:efflux RND transporter periplasmic adaptor subunit [Deltaproteobacteria bacterium]
MIDYSPMTSIKKISVLLVAGLLSTVLAGCERNSSATKTDPKEAQPSVLPVTVTPVRAQKVQRTVEFVGTLYANEEVAVSSELEGRILSIAADLGDRVGAGQALAKIHDAEFRFAVEQAEAGLKETLAKLGLEKVPPQNFDVAKTSPVIKAKAELDDTQINLKRMKALYDEKVISAQEYDTAATRAKTALATYKGSLEEAKALVATAYVKEAQLGNARKKLRDTTIQAPLGGAISKRSVSAGEFVKVGAHLFTVVQDNPLKLRGMIPERFAPELQTGQAVEIKVDPFPDRKYAGKITRISPSAEVTSRSFLVEGVIDNRGQQLRPNFFAKATIITRTDPNALTVPQQALVSFAGVTKVFVVEKEVAHERVVRTGIRVGANEVEITAGLRPGELVAISGLTRLTDGAPVKVSGPIMPQQKERPGSESR